MAKQRKGEMKKRREMMNENMDLSPPVAVCVCDSVDESGTGGSEELICSHIWLLVIGQGLANLSGH